MQSLIRAAAMTTVLLREGKFPLTEKNGATFEIILSSAALWFSVTYPIVFDLAMSDKAESKKVRNSATLGFQSPVIVYILPAIS